MEATMAASSGSSAQKRSYKSVGQTHTRDFGSPEQRGRGNQNESPRSHTVGK